MIRTNVGNTSRMTHFPCRKTAYRQTCKPIMQENRLNFSEKSPCPNRFRDKNMKPALKFIAVLLLVTAFAFSGCGGGGGGGGNGTPIYTVTYAGNGNTGGSVPTDSTNYQEGAAVTVLGNTDNLQRDGYTFVGWCVNASGTGDSYTQGQTFIMGTADVTLDAKRIPATIPTYTVTYSGNGNTGGSIPVDSTNYQEGAAVTVLGNTGNLQRDGYAFASWCVNANGTGSSYTQGQTFTMGTADVTLMRSGFHTAQESLIQPSTQTGRSPHRWWQVLI